MQIAKRMSDFPHEHYTNRPWHRFSKRHYKIGDVLEEGKDIDIPPERVIIYASIPTLRIIGRNYAPIMTCDKRKYYANQALDLKQKEELESLFISIKEKGIVCPLVLRQSNAEVGMYHTLNGPQRLWVAKELAIQWVDCIVNCDLRPNDRPEGIRLYKLSEALAYFPIDTQTLVDTQGDVLTLDAEYFR